MSDEERPTPPDPDPWDVIERAYRARDQAKEQAVIDADAASPGARGEGEPLEKRPTDGPL